MGSKKRAIKQVKKLIADFCQRQYTLLDKGKTPEIDADAFEVMETIGQNITYKRIPKATKYDPECLKGAIETTIQDLYTIQKFPDMMDDEPENGNLLAQVVKWAYESEMEAVKNDNPFLDWAVNSIENERFEIEAWMIEDWLENHSNEHCKNEEQYKRYHQLNEALTQKESEE